ncbi:MAG: hypothetical protein VXZ39_09280, partial [Planctomycetota bacterium]|nr:hypothetical protein [Planctomycetota bacterium]
MLLPRSRSLVLNFQVGASPSVPATPLPSVGLYAGPGECTPRSEERECALLSIGPASGVPGSKKRLLVPKRVVGTSVRLAGSYTGPGLAGSALMCWRDTKGCAALESVNFFDLPKL